jgi:hypothetical protein
MAQELKERDDGYERRLENLEKEKRLLKEIGQERQGVFVLLEGEGVIDSRAGQTRDTNGC